MELEPIIIQDVKKLVKTCLFEYEYLLNFTCHTMKFHNCAHTNLHGDPSRRLGLTVFVFDGGVE